VNGFEVSKIGCLKKHTLPGGTALTSTPTNNVKIDPVNAQIHTFIEFCCYGKASQLNSAGAIGEGRRRGIIAAAVAAVAGFFGHGITTRHTHRVRVLQSVSTAAAAAATAAAVLSLFSFGDGRQLVVCDRFGRTAGRRGGGE
jgi:hypothetical protein